MANTISIPLSAPVDLETKNIIQGDFSFTRKNSILHQGLLSNMKRKIGTGLLSTTGKELWASNQVAGNQYINGIPVKTIEIKEVDGDVVASASIRNGTTVYTINVVQVSIDDFYIKFYNTRKLQASIHIQLHLATSQSFTPITSSFDITQIGTTGFAIIGVFNDADGNTSEWRGITSLTSITNSVWRKIGLKLGGEVQIAYDGSIWVGFEDLDVRKRCSYCYDNVTKFYEGTGHENTTIQHSARIPGFGSLSKTSICRMDGSNPVYSPVLITGEPLFAEVHFTDKEYNSHHMAATQYDTLRDSGEYGLHTRWDLYNPMQIDFTSLDSTTYSSDPHAEAEVLENGVIQISPMYRRNKLQYNDWSGQTGFTTITSDKNPIALLKGLKNDPDSVDGTQVGVSDWPKVAFFDMNCNMTEGHKNANISMQRGFLCYYAFISNKRGSFYSKTFNALDRAYLPNAFSSDSQRGFRLEGAKTGTAISFCDYDNPIGLLGNAIIDENSDYDGQQLFPHARWFCNDTTKKGIHWDYGRGWTTFIKDTIEVYRMGDSFRVFERPLELWRFTTEEANNFYTTDLEQRKGTISLTTHPQISYLDIVSKKHVGECIYNYSGPSLPVADYISDVAFFDRWGVDNIGNDRNEVIKETEFVAFRLGDIPTFGNIFTTFSEVGSAEDLFGTKVWRTKLFINNEWKNYEDWLVDFTGTAATERNAPDVLQIIHQYYPGVIRLLRYHPITESQVSATTWKYSHHLGGEGENALLSSIPWSFGVWKGEQNGINSPRMQIYNGEIISVSLNDILMTTPHDLKNKYNFIDGTNSNLGFTMWDTDTVYICYPDTSSSAVNKNFKKMADYTFKSPFISKYPNVLLESRNGTFKLSKAFIPYMMDSIIDTENKGFAPKLPPDSDSMISNDTYMYGFGYNVNATDEDAVSSSFLLPAVVISSYCDADDLYKFNSIILNGRKGLFRADVRNYFSPGYPIDEYYTHSQASTDITYKNSREYVNYFETKDEYREELVNTSWWLTADTVLYPIGYLSKTYGENYITSTVDVGDNYVSRFYRNNNKTLLNFNMKDTVYYGSEIFTIQSGNYYFDGQGIYYLGSQSDYSQNIFTAYAIGMKFLANSSSEAYFYSEWDKSLYLYTASNTLQKAQSLADMGTIVDSVYGSAEQALYILFDDGKLFLKTQSDSCIIEGVLGNKLQSTNIGVFTFDSTGYEIHNPYIWEVNDTLYLETEWLGNSDTVSKYQYVDVVLYSDEPVSRTFNVTVKALNGGVISDSTKTVKTELSDWKNNLCRVRVVPKEIIGNAVKVYIESKDEISIFSLSISVEQTSTIPSASRSKRY